jgi:transposase-like protein
MLSEKILKYLKKTPTKPFAYQKKYKYNFETYGFTTGLNASFLEFMIRCDEYSGSQGFIMDVANDMLDFENSVIRHLRNHNGLGKQYYALYNLELDDFLLYNKDNDNVKLIEAQHMNKLSDESYYGKKWPSFNGFLFVELQR